MNRDWLVDVVARLPQTSVSRAWGWLAQRTQPRLGVAVLKRAFVAAVGIDMSEAQQSVSDYESLEALFVRRLRPGVRRIDPSPEAMVCPVDGKVGACGVVQDGTVLQVKGRRYGVGALLGNEDEAARFEGGAFATFYLAPKDYHRIHAPLSGAVGEARLIPGGLMPVFPEALQKVDGLFVRNERIVTYLDTAAAGRLAVVKVGATLVGRITVQYDDALVGNAGEKAPRHVVYDPPRLLQKGAELGAFELGSTVVVFAEPGRAVFDHLHEGDRSVMGQRMGTVVASNKGAGSSRSSQRSSQRSGTV